MTNDTVVKTSPRTMKGIKDLALETPEESIARISLSEENLPTVINAPTRQAKGKDIDTTAGKVYMMSSRTSLGGTCLESTSSANSSMLLTKKMKKKNEKATKNERKNSREI